MKNKIINIMVGMILMMIIIFPVYTIAAPSTPSTSTTPSVADDKYGLSDVKDSGVVTQSAPEVAGTIIQTIIGITGVILVIVLIYGGVLYMTSGGNEEKTATAKKAITYGIVGVVIIALAFAITRFVLDALIKQ